MPDPVDPILDQWYLRDDTGERFLVTAYDEKSGSIEIQTSEGDLDELDTEIWRSTSMRPVDPPEDWTESFDSELADDDELADDRLDSEGGTAPDDLLDGENEPAELEDTEEPPLDPDERGRS
jgi:hypothetical protein